MGLFDTEERWQVYIALNLVMSIIGSCATSLNIVVISKMKMTGYLLLLLTMSCYQLMYDLTFFFSNVNVGYWPTTIANIFQIIGGVGGSLTSNTIAFVVMFIVARRKSVEIFKYYKYMLWFSLVPAVVNAIVYMAGTIPENAKPHIEHVALYDMYYYTRLVSIFINFILFGISAYRIQKIRSKGTARTPAEIAISTLSRRLIYYPILQAIGRSGYAYYEALYGTDIDQTDASKTQYAGLIFLTMVTPIVSIGYLVIFLMMQPTAYDHFKALFGIPIKPKEDPRVSRVTRVNRPTAVSFYNNQPRPSDGADISGPKSTVGWTHSAYGAHDIDELNEARGTSIWNKSSIFHYDEEQAEYDERSEEELFATLKNQNTNQSMTDADELSTTNSTLHPSLSSAGSASTSSHRPGLMTAESLSGHVSDFIEL